MAIKSLARSSILQPQETRFALAGYQTNMFHHLETIRLSSSASAVEFTNLGQYSDYQHLQIRLAARTQRSNSNVDLLNLQLNGITTGSYCSHAMVGNGSSVVALATSANNTYIYGARGAGNTASSGAFGGGIIDILDPFETSKNTTTRILSGTDAQVWLSSGVFLNTSAINSVTLYPDVGPNILAGSRFSLSGLKVRA